MEPDELHLDIRHALTLLFGRQPTHLPYLLRGCRNTSDRLQRIYLIWQLDDLGSSPE